MHIDVFLCTFLLLLCYHIEFLIFEDKMNIPKMSLLAMFAHVAFSLESQ